MVFYHKMQDGSTELDDYIKLLQSTMYVLTHPTTCNALSGKCRISFGIVAIRNTGNVA